MKGHDREIVVVYGDSKCPGGNGRTCHVAATAWSGALRKAPAGRWRNTPNPLGALAAAGLVAGEVFKTAMRALRPFAICPSIFDELFERTFESTVALAPRGTPLLRLDLGETDVISCGAISQAALYALSRVPGFRMHGRLIEPDTSDISNLNRNAFLRRSRVGVGKADDVATWLTSGMELTPVVLRFTEESQEALGQLAPTVLVGVDHIPTRWLVQRQWPQWLGVGATTHFSAMASFHAEGLPCAGCLHPRDDDLDAPVPTVSFVSHWAGLCLATFAVCGRPEDRIRDQQQVFMTMLRPDRPRSIWRSRVPFNTRCPVGCQDSRAHAARWSHNTQ